MVDGGEWSVSVPGIILSVHECVELVVCWFDSESVTDDKPCELPEETSEVTWVAAREGNSEMTSEVKLILASVVILEGTLVVKLETTPEGIPGGTSVVKV